MVSKDLLILLVDDSKADIALLSRQLKKRFNVSILVAHDGAEAIQILNNEESSLPHFVILDLNMPSKDGREVLAEMKLSERMRTIPVVIMTTSEDPADIEKAYKFGANAYINKPSGDESYEQLADSILDFWAKRVLFYRP